MTVFEREHAVVVGAGVAGIAAAGCSSPRARAFASRTPRRASGSAAISSPGAARRRRAHRRPRSSRPRRRDARGREPRRPAHRRRPAVGARARAAGLGRDGARRAARPGALARRDRDERQDDDDRDARGVPAGRRPGRRRVRQHRPAVPDGRARAARRARRGGLVVPARGADVVPSRGLRAAQPRARPPGPSRFVRGVRIGEGADLRAPAGDDVHVGNRDDPAAAALSAAAPCAVVWFRLGEPAAGEVGFVGGRLVARLGATPTSGRSWETDRRYRADAAAAAAAALAFGVEPGAIVAGLAAFAPEPHRGEVVARAGGVRFVDNSKATNVHAALAAIDGVRDAVLIAGGRAKGQDLSRARHAVGSARRRRRDRRVRRRGRAGVRGTPARAEGRLDRGGGPNRLRAGTGGGGRAARPGLRELGSVRRLRGTRRPVRRRRACHRRGGGRRWLIAGPARRGRRAPRPQPVATALRRCA